MSNDNKPFDCPPLAPGSEVINSRSPHIRKDGYYLEGGLWPQGRIITFDKATVAAVASSEWMALAWARQRLVLVLYERSTPESIARTNKRALQVADGAVQCENKAKAWREWAKD